VRNRPLKPQREKLSRYGQSLKGPASGALSSALPPEQAIMTLKAFWPQLFDGDSPRLLATGMREQLFADIAGRDLPLSHKQVIKCLKSLTRSAGYLSRMREGASRYDLQGNVVATVTADEAHYASERMMKELLRAERKMSQTV
jgi:sRNA-binding protein